jgi:hypothetical protein
VATACRLWRLLQRGKATPRRAAGEVRPGLEAGLLTQGAQGGGPSGPTGPTIPSGSNPLTIGFARGLMEATHRRPPWLSESYLITPGWKPPAAPGLPRVKVIDGNIPTMVYLPPAAGELGGNGTLLAVGQAGHHGPDRLLLHRSSDGGASWGAVQNPTAPGLMPPFKTPQTLEQPQLGYDAQAGRAFLFFTVVDATPHGGARARLHCHFALLVIHFIPGSRRESVPLFFKKKATMRPNPRRRLRLWHSERAGILEGGEHGPWSSGVLTQGDQGDARPPWPCHSVAFPPASH